MATNLQVTCIKKTNRIDPHERIHGIGGTNADSTKWYLAEAIAITAIKNGSYRFWISANGKTVRVIIATHNGHKYLKTESDGNHPNNLLALPECP
jgi:hypothetical protein